MTEIESKTEQNDVETVLSVEKLSKTFGKNTVLKDITFSVKRGEVVSIIGSSGSGKSTLLRCISMLEKVSSGKIEVEGMTLVSDNENGKSVYADKETQHKIQCSLGMVFQSFNLFPHFNVIRNVTDAPIHVLGVDSETAIEEGMKLLESVGLSDRADYYPDQLSGGQSQRVAIARALAMKPGILCFDEPTSALDPELTGEVLKVMKKLKNEHRTMIIVTHEMEFARAVSDRIIFMSGGIIEEEGTPEEVFGNPKSSVTRSFLANSLNKEY